MAKVKRHPINDHDIINYLQDNQAMLKTMMQMMEKQFGITGDARKEVLKKYHKNLKEIQDTFDAKKTIQ